jgi:hypothetical protein
VNAMSSAFCAEVKTGSEYSSMTASRVTTADLAKHVLSRQSCGHLRNTQRPDASYIISEQSCSGGPESTCNRVARFRVLTTSSQICRLSHNMLCQPIISFIFHKSQNRVGNSDCEFLSQSKIFCFSQQDSSGHQSAQAVQSA